MNPDGGTPRRSKRVADWLFSSDPRRRIRLTQTGIALVLVIVCCGVMAYAVWVGFAPAMPVHVGSRVARRHRRRLHRNPRRLVERLPDPSLTLEQIVWSIGCCAAGYVIAGPLRARCSRS